MTNVTELGSPGPPAVGDRTREGSRPRLRRAGVPVLVILAAVAAVAAPLAIGDVAVQYLIAYVVIMSLLALALHLCMGIAGIFTLGQAALFGTGAYLGVVLMDRVSLDGVVALPMVGLAGALLGALMAVVTLRVSDLYLALTTLAFGFIGENVVRNSDHLGGATGILGYRLSFAGHPLDEPRLLYWVGLGHVLIFMVVIASVRRSKIGRALMAGRESPIAARSIGIDTRRYRVLALALGGAFAAVAGGLYPAYALVLDPTVYGLDLTLAVLTIAIIGGLRSMPGVIGATVLLTYFRNSAESFGVAPYVLLIYGAFVVLTLRFLPAGVAGLFGSPGLRAAASHALRSFPGRGR